MALDLLTLGEALVEVMRTEIDQPLNRPALFTGPYPSGAPFIFAMQAARLGMRAAAIGAVGDDAFGQCLLDQLHTDGVDTRGVYVLKTHTTGVAFVAYNTDGSRDFVFHIAAAAGGQIHEPMVDESLFDGLKCLHLMGSALSINADVYRAGRRAVDLAQQVGAKISFDPNLRPELMPVDRARTAFAPFLEAADVIIPTTEEAVVLTGQANLDAAINVLLKNRPERVIVLTQGAEGCTVYTGGEAKQKVPGFPVVEVDPTGAGDCFDAGFLARWLKGETPADAARFANACGALAVTVKGPAEGARHFDEVMAFMAQHDDMNG